MEFQKRILAGGGGGGESDFRKVGQNVHRARGGLLKKVTKMTAYLKVLSI